MLKHGSDQHRRHNHLHRQRHGYNLILILLLVLIGAVTTEDESIGGKPCTKAFWTQSLLRGH
jgi:hypothetical protein